MMRVAWVLPLLALGWLLGADAAAGLRSQWVAHGAGPPLLAALLIAASHGLRAARLRVEWGPRRGVGLVECLRVSLLHTAAVNLLPMRGGELGFPLLLRRRWGVPLADAAGALLWLRVQDLVVMAWLLALAAAAWLAPQGAGAAAAAPVLAGLATGGFVLAVRQRPRSLPRHRPAAGWLARLRLAWQRALAAATPASWTLTVANWLCKLGGLALLFAAWAQAPVLAAWGGALGGELAAVLPVQAPGGFGSYEAAMAAGARALAPLNWLPLLTAALAVHVFALALSLAGAAWALRPAAPPQTPPTAPQAR
jgi:hypothetical protein